MEPTAVAVAGAAAGVALAAVLLVLVLAARLRRLERACDALMGDERGAASFVTAVRRSQTLGEGLRRDLDAVRGDLAQARADLGTALRHVAVVRYDAFDDLAGRLSFSAALLDDAGDGVVLTSINGRNETRTYAKGVVGGGSRHPLSPEEKEAVARARTTGPVAVAAPLEQAG